jgi:hypothetical protein
MLKDLTHTEVKELFTYDKEEGLLRWRNPSGRYGRIPAGEVAGSTTNKEGYRYVTVNGKNYRGSRIIWLYVTGEWPDVQVDHEDRNTSNDKWTNLRLASGSQNKANSSKYGGKPKSSLLKGVQAVQKARGIRYRAIATKDGVREHLGYFDTEEQAHAAYLVRSKELHGEFASDGKPPD